MTERGYRPEIDGLRAYFQNTTGGYFDVSSSELPLLHLWSLSVEEQ